LNRKVIPELDSVGVTSFRINMSHTDLADLERVIRFIQECTKVPICIDTEGAQIRTGAVESGFGVTAGGLVRIVPDPGRGGPSTIPISPGAVLRALQPGAIMSIDFDSVLLRIDSVGPEGADATVLTGGEIGTHKAVTVLPSPALPTFSPKDLEAVKIALRFGIREFALSFCEDPGSVHALRTLVGPDSTIIAKIESRMGVRNLTGIAEVADALLIDRGDLSREVRLEVIPLLQKAIIRKANALGIPVYVATNLLESMGSRRTPTRAEVNDVINTLMDGADGLVLAAETAIGKFPVEAARMIAALMNEYEGSIDGYRIEDLLGEHPLSIHQRPAEPPGEHGSASVPSQSATIPVRTERNEPGTGHT
jgi:pyruvate kinase